MYITISSFISEELIGECRASIIDYSLNTPSRDTNNARGGSYFRNKWLSTKDLHLNGDCDLNRLLAEILKCANLCGPILGSTSNNLEFHTCWAMISLSGFEGYPHCHAGLVSGVFYIDSGSSSYQEGALKFCTQSGVVTSIIKPKTGELILFPSTQYHFVSSYLSEQKRIVFSFNLC